MGYTAYRVLKAPINQIESLMTQAIEEGWQPLGGPTVLYPDDKMVYQAIVKGTPDGGGGGPVTIVVADISDATDTGKAVMLAASAAEARTALDAVSVGDLSALELRIEALEETP